MRVVGYADRTVLKDTLGLVLAKTPDEKALFDECFDLYFKRDGFAPDDAAAPGDAAPTPGQAAGGGEGMGSGGGGSLGRDAAGRRPRRAGDRGGGRPAREAGLENIRFFTQRNLYARRVLDRMGLRGVERDMASLRRAATAAANARADLLEERIERLREQVRDLVDRNLLLFARGETEKFREELLRSARLTNLERRDLDADARAGPRDRDASWRRATPSRGGASCAGSSMCAARSGATWRGTAFPSSRCGSRSGSRSRG